MSSLPDQAGALSQAPDTIQPSPQTDCLLISTPSSSTSMQISPAPSTINETPAASQLPLSRSVDCHYIPRDTQATHPAPSPLALPSTATLSPPVTPVPTALSDMPLLQPPQPRPISHSSPPRPGPQPREQSPPGAPYRLTSPSTTTLLSSAHAVRDAPAPPHALHTSAQRSPSPEPQSAVAEVSPSPPPSPYPQSRASTATASDVFEEFTWEPRQRWSADRRLGFSLEERVQREFERRHTEEAISAFTGNQARAPVDPRTRLCLHCGSHRPIDSRDIQSINEDSEEEQEEDDISELSRRSPSPHPDKGKSPYMHHPSRSTAKLMSSSRSTLLKTQSPGPASPASPQSPNVSTFFKMPSAWASSVTLSLSTAIGHGHNAHGSDKGSDKSSITLTSSKPLKRRESFGVKRLFGSLKGKDRDHGRSNSVPGTAMSSAVPLDVSAVSSDSSSTSTSESTSESVDGWEVVSVKTEPIHSRSSSTAPTSPTRSLPESSATSPTVSASSPTIESAHPAFLNRPVRPRPTIPESPAAPSSPLSTPVTPKTVLPPPTISSATTAARPYLPEKSPLRMLVNTQQARQAHTQTLPVTDARHVTPLASTPLTSSNIAAPAIPPTPSTPRSPRPSPSVIWKVPSPIARSPLAQPPTPSTPSSPSSSLAPESPTLATNSHSQPPTQPTRLVMPPIPVHPAVAALSRSEKSALRHQSAPLPPRSPARLRDNLIARDAPMSPVPSSPSLAPSPADGQAHLRQRRAVTPPPSHRRAILSYHTGSVPESSPLASFEPGAHFDYNGGIAPDTEESGDDEDSASLEQLLAAEEGRASIPSSAPAPAVSVTTPTTPTTPTSPAWVSASPRQSSHFPGRPLPRLPAEPEVPVKRVPDGYPVNRLPEANYGRSTSATPLRAAAVLLPPSPALSACHVPPPPSPPPLAPAPPPAALSVPAVAYPMERAESGGSVLEDARAAEEGPRYEFLQVTDLDVLASRVFDSPADGRNYEVRLSPCYNSSRACSLAMYARNRTCCSSPRSWGPPGRRRGLRRRRRRCRSRARSRSSGGGCSRTGA